MAYRKIDPSMWDDDLMIDLPTVEQRFLWVYLLCGPHTTPLPGLFTATAGGIAEGLRIPFGNVSEGLAELVRRGRIQVDERRRLIRVVNAPRYNLPENGNVLRSWWALYKTIPESPLKTAHLVSMEAAISGQKQDVLTAWAETFGTIPKPWVNVPETLSIPSPTHKHKHKHQHEHQHTPSPPAAVGVSRPPKPQEPPPTGPLSAIVNKQLARLSAPTATEPAANVPGQNFPLGGWPGCPGTHQERQDALTRAYAILNAQVGDGRWKPATIPLTESIAAALRMHPLCAEPDPYTALTETVVLGVRGHAIFAEGKGNRQLHILLREANLNHVLEHARARAKGIDPNRSGPKPPRPSVPLSESHAPPVFKPPEEPPKTTPEERRAVLERARQARQT